MALVVDTTTWSSTDGRASQNNNWRSWFSSGGMQLAGFGGSPQNGKAITSQSVVDAERMSMMNRRYRRSLGSLSQEAPEEKERSIGTQSDPIPSPR